MTEVTEEEFFYFVRISKDEVYDNKSTWKNSTKHYCCLFVKHLGKEIFVSWNMWAFLFREVWFIYRRMWLKVICFNLLIIPLEVLILFIELSWLKRTPIYYWPIDALKNLFFVSDIYNYNLSNYLKLYIWIISFLPFLISGLFGDYLYINWLRKKIIKAKNKNKELAYTGLKKIKSVTYIGVAISSCLFCALQGVSGQVLYIGIFFFVIYIISCIFSLVKIVISLIITLLKPIIIIIKKLASF